MIKQLLVAKSLDNGFNAQHVWYLVPILTILTSIVLN
jgi:hypothetical protein